MDRGEFGRRALEALTKARPTDVSVFDSGKFQILTTDTDGQSFLTSLGNYYDEYVHAAPEAKEAVFQRIARHGRLIDTQETLDEVRVLLMPRIRPRRHFEIDTVHMLADLGSEPADKAPVSDYTPLAEHLGVAVAIDRPEHIEYVSSASRFGVPFAELSEIALANLKRQTKTGLVALRPGVWSGSWGDDYAPERLLMPELFTEVAKKPVVFLPGSSEIYVVSADDEESIVLALALVEQRKDAPRFLLDLAFVLEDGRWRPFEPDGDLGELFGSRLALHLADAYALQREALQTKYDGQDDAPFVPNVMAIAGDGLELTWATWGDGIHALLPRTHLVAVGRIDTGDMGMIPWSDVMKLAGECLTQVPGVYPPRWETKRFPDEATFEKLLERAINPKRKAREPAPASSISAALPAVREAPSRTRKLVAAAILVVMALVIVHALSR